MKTPVIERVNTRPPLPHSGLYYIGVLEYVNVWALSCRVGCQTLPLHAQVCILYTVHGNTIETSLNKPQPFVWQGVDIRSWSSKVRSRVTMDREGEPTSRETDSYQLARLIRHEWRGLTRQKKWAPSSPLLEFGWHFWSCSYKCIEGASCTFVKYRPGIHIFWMWWKHSREVCVKTSGDMG